MKGGIVTLAEPLLSSSLENIQFDYKEWASTFDSSFNLGETIDAQNLYECVLDGEPPKPTFFVSTGVKIEKWI